MGVLIRSTRQPWSATNPDPVSYTHLDVYKRQIPECVVGPLYTCPTARDIAAVQAASPQPLRPSFSDVSAIARQLVLTMSVDRPVIRVGPDPSANEWNLSLIHI